MGVMLSRRRYGGSSENVLYELYNQYFDGTVNSVIDTGIKLWNGDYPNFKLELEFEMIEYADNETIFTVKPDVSPYSGIRLRREKKTTQLQFMVSDPLTYQNKSSEIIAGTSVYGSNFNVNKVNGTQTFLIIKQGNTMFVNINGYTVDITITEPLTNNFNLLIGCDYKSTDQTQRYFKGTVHKFKLVKL